MPANEKQTTQQELAQDFAAQAAAIAAANAADIDAVDASAPTTPVADAAAAAKEASKWSVLKVTLSHAAYANVLARATELGITGVNDHDVARMLVVRACNENAPSPLMPIVLTEDTDYPAPRVSGAGAVALGVDAPTNTHRTAQFLAYATALSIDGGVIPGIPAANTMSPQLSVVSAAPRWGELFVSSRNNRAVWTTDACASIPGFSAWLQAHERKTRKGTTTTVTPPAN